VPGNDFGVDDSFDDIADDPNIASRIDSWMCASASLIEDADDDDDDDVRDNFGVELNDEVGVSVDIEDADMPEIRLRLFDSRCSPYMFVRPFLQKKHRLHIQGLKGFWRSHFGRFELSLMSVQSISMPRHISPNPRWTIHVHHPIVLVVYISQGSALPVPSNPPSLLISSRLLLDCFTIPFVTERMFASVALIK